MKKIKFTTLFIIIFLFITILTSCKNNNNEIKDYEEMNINVDGSSIKIMQLTDLHLSYGFDYLDKKTYKMLDYLIKLEEPDLIVITGDMFMSILAKPLLKSFIKFIEKYETPWTVSFGNHEREYHNINVVVNILMNAKTNFLYFHPGLKLSNDNTHGASNFKINIKLNGIDHLSVYSLDSKDMRTDGIKDKDFPYDYVSEEQVNWIKEEVKKDSNKNIVFMHMPLEEWLLYDKEPKERMWPQGKNTNLFNTLKEENKTLGIFVGHDHNNEHEFYLNNILLAYGRNSGYNAYGTYTKGARIIIVDNNYNLNTYLVGDKDE